MKNVPKGWVILADEILHAAAVFEIPGIPEFSIEKGLMRIHYERIDGYAIDYILFERICQSVSSSSSKICMECGKRGLRRKLEKDWPCLCSRCYLEFANNEE